MVEKKNLMRKPEGIGPVKGANFEGAFRVKNDSVKKQLTLKIDEMVAVERGVTITELVSGFIRKL